jgi:peptide/nickel transport system permease protein
MSMITPPPEFPPATAASKAPSHPAATLAPERAAELRLAPPGKPRGLARRAWEVFTENKLALAGLAFLIFIVLFCFVGPLFYHTNQVNTQLSNYLCKPSGEHLLGCNDLGYDELGRLMIGGQTSLEVGIAAAIVAVAFGALYGAISGFAGGAADSILMRIVDAGLSLPFIMVLIILSVIFHPNPATMVLIIAAFYWFGPARLVRGETLSLRTREYVQAVKVLGGRQMRSVTRHILPNAVGVIVVQATFAVADSILILSGLGFLGLGVTPPAADWGSMLSGGLNYIQSGNYWWLIYPPGICIILTCISFNFIGDALRDAFENRLQRR